MTKKQATELIKRRRNQILIHSCIYYAFSDSVVSDNQWTEWAIELENLQAKYPEIADGLPWAEAFKNFDHSTGYNLPIREPWVMGRAKHILKYAKEKKT